MPRVAVAGLAATALLGLLAAALALAAGRVEANGASTIIMDRTQGPYRVVVGIIPARPVIPRTHLAIQVFDVADGRLLRDTEVRLLVFASGPPGTPEFGPQAVVNDQSLRYFEVDVPFQAVGSWDVSLTVSSERGEELFALPMEVGEPGAQIQWVWVSVVLTLIIVAGIWTWLTMQRRRAGA